MGCKAPIQATRDGAGRVRVLPRFFSPTESLKVAELEGAIRLELPCGRCMQCRIAQAQDWATRCTHEASMHRHPDGTTNGCMITLTFENAGLELRELRYGTHPSTLCVADWQLFAKRMRQHFLRKQRAEEKQKGMERQPLKPIKFFHVGEYGEKYKRPHYHALLFGQDFQEDATWGKDKNGNDYFLSPTLAKLWPYGNTEGRPLVQETISYVCRYVTKKLNGPMRNAALERLDPDTGEIIQVAPEYATMSRGGRTGEGIGATWFDRYRDDVFPDNFVVMKGKKTRVPRYYTKRLKQQDPEMAEAVADLSSKSAARRVKESLPERRLVKEKIAISKSKLYASNKLDY